MPTFYFDVMRNGRRFVDEVGQSFTDLPTARQEAIQCVLELGRDKMRDPGVLTVLVRDGENVPVLSANLEVWVAEDDVPQDPADPDEASGSWR